MLASDWSRGRGWFLTPVGMYHDVPVVNRMYLYIRNQDQSLIWSEKVVLKKISDPPPLQCSAEHPHNAQLGQEGGYPRHLAQCLKGKSTNKSCQDRPDQ